MHLADAFIQSDLQCIQDIHIFLSVCALALYYFAFFTIIVGLKNKYLNLIKCNKNQ